MDMNINNSDSDHEVVVVESNVIVNGSLQTNNAQKKEAYFTESSSGSDNEGVRYVQTGRVRNCHDDTSIQCDYNHNVYSETDSEELCEIEQMSIKHSTSNPIPIPTSNFLAKALVLSTPPTSGETQIKFFTLIFFFTCLANIGVAKRLSTGRSKNP